MPTRHEELRATATRLHALVEGLTPEQLRTPAYPTEWTIADTLSHLGSAALINQRRLEDALAGRAWDDEFAPTVWASWNAKTPEEQASGYLAASAALLGLLDGLTAEQRSEVSISMGPLTFDLDTYVGLLLNEQVLHAWDVEVALDPDATLPESATSHVVDNLAMIAGWTAKATEPGGRLEVRTDTPERRFTLTLGPERVTLEPSLDGAAPDLRIPAEALVRLIYGRLDAEHTPTVEGSVDLDGIRAVFPGP